MTEMMKDGDAAERRCLCKDANVCANYSVIQSHEGAIIVRQEKLRRNSSVCKCLLYVHDDKNERTWTAGARHG